MLLLWIGLSFSAIGDQLYALALAWIAVSALGANAGYLSAIQAFVVLLAALGIGRWADRWDRRRSMIGADVVRALVLVLVAALWMIFGKPDVVQLVVAIVILALGEAIFDPALHALLPSLVEDIRLLPAANGLLDATDRSARLLGPGLIALLAGVIPLVHFLTLDALTFLLSAATILMIGRNRIGETMSPPEEGEGFVRSAMRGVHAMLGHPLLGYTLSTAGLLNGAWSCVFFLGLPLLLQHKAVMGLGGGGLGAYGAVISAYGCTNLLATILFGSRGLSRRPQRQMFLGNVIVGSGLGMLGLASLLPGDRILMGLMGAAAFSAIGGPMKDIPLAILRQTCLERNVVAAAVRASMAANSAGTLFAFILSPWAFAHAGALPVVVACGIAIMLIGVVGLARYSSWQESYQVHAT